MSEEQKISLMAHQAAVLYSPYPHTAMFGGIASGKTFTGSHFSIKLMLEYPEITGFIGANTYDQLNQATLRELFHWLDEYGVEYVINKRPPSRWGSSRLQFARYNNILSVRSRAGVTTVFTRVLGQPDPLRGLEFSWYWLDETRDTPQNTHDVVLGRMRESDFARGLITTTTNGEDWAYERFVKNGNVHGGLYGAWHVPTLAAVNAGTITQNYYQTLLASFSPLMAQQELEAKHVNVLGGRAYHSAGDWNKLAIAPWGDAVPTRDRPLVVGCDFNYSPAPMVWVVGQLGPYGSAYERNLHIFGEMSDVNTSSESMALRLIGQYPGYFIRMFGDASGNRETTSNAGATDFKQITSVFEERQVPHELDTDQANPRVKDRVENVCAHLRNAAGEVSITYNPDACPMLDGDLRKVGWKPTGKLDDGGDVQRTHAGDGLGYMVWKILPPEEHGAFAPSVRSIASQLEI